MVRDAVLDELKFSFGWTQIRNNAKRLKKKKEKKRAIIKTFASGEPNLRLVECYLQSLAFVGVFEQMVDTWKSLRRRFHWTSVKFSEVKRKTPTKAEILRKSLTKEQIAKIKAFQVKIWEDSVIWISSVICV